MSHGKYFFASKTLKGVFRDLYQQRDVKKNFSQFLPFNSDTLSYLMLQTFPKNCVVNPRRMSEGYGTCSVVRSFILSIELQRSAITSTCW